MVHEDAYRIKHVRLGLNLKHVCTFLHIMTRAQVSILSYQTYSLGISTHMINVPSFRTNVRYSPESSTTAVLGANPSCATHKHYQSSANRRNVLKGGTCEVLVPCYGSLDVDCCYEG